MVLEIIACPPMSVVMNARRNQKSPISLQSYTFFRNCEGCVGKKKSCVKFS